MIGKLKRKKRRKRRKKKAKTEIKINYVSNKDTFLFYLITFSIEVKNVKNKIGFIKLVVEKDTIFGLIEIDLKDSSFKKEFSFLKTDLVSFTTKTVRAKLICDGQIAESKFFELGPKENKTCYCNRDFTVAEIINIVVEIRKNTFYNNQTIYSYHGEKLFYRNELTKKEYETEIMPETDRTFEKLTLVVNKNFKKYKINNCIQKIHFLAQMYTETEYFTKTIEGTTSDLSYDPYRGRGFMHLTDVKNYTAFTKDNKIDILDPNYDKVSKV